MSHRQQKGRRVSHAAAMAKAKLNARTHTKLQHAFTIRRREPMTHTVSAEGMLNMAHGVE
jgi:hypothetical protein